MRTGFSQDSTGINNAGDSTSNISADSGFGIQDRMMILESLKKQFGKGNKDSASATVEQIKLDSNLKINKVSYGLWRPGDMVVESACGAGFGLLGAVVGAMFGSFFHTAGDTSKEGNDITLNAVYIGMGIGHAIGSSLGVNFGGKISGVKGSKILSFIGGATGEVLSLYLYVNRRNFLTGTLLAILPSVMATLMYNLIKE